MKFCKDCIHCELRSDDGGRAVASIQDFDCAKTRTRELVMGREVMETCFNARNNVSMCGIEAKWFEKNSTL